ncbi:hypothetical protein F9C11_26520 [Amycolatopsis sp. VS8301801F10]|uniref:hypothetical protein n=1 Tax=unclassified Amycolatopsis TaxID=2618356 RepID=UPI0038FCBD3A
MIPYNVLLPDFHKAMIDAEQAHIPTLRSAATMWSEVHAWSQTAAAELRRNAGTVTLAGWQDKAADSFEAKVGRSIADLTTWSDRIAASQVSTQLNALADTLPVTQGLVEGFYAEYAAARMNPLTWELALQAWQSSATVMNELGAQYDGAMLAVCGAAGVTNPADLIPNFAISSADAVKTADAAVNLLTEVQSLAQAAGIGGGSGASADLSKLTGGVNLNGAANAHGLSLNPEDWKSGQGLALAGLGPGSLSPGDLGGALGGMPGLSPAGSAPVASGLPFGALGAAGAGLGAMPAMRSPAAKRGSAEPEGTASGSARGGAGGMLPPMTPHGMGAATAGTLRPGAAENTDGHSAGGRRRSTAHDGVTVALRGRTGGGPEASAPGPGRFGESGTGTVELIAYPDER